MSQVLPRPTAPKQAFRSSNRSDTETVSEGDESDDVGSGLDDELPFLSPQPNVRFCHGTQSIRNKTAFSSACAALADLSLEHII